MGDELEVLCERAHSDPAALRRVGDAAWAKEPRRCGRGVALSPLWGSVEAATEKRLVERLLQRAAHGEDECRALAGLIRGQAVRASIMGRDIEEDLQSALVEVLERGDKHALFALFILAVLIMDEPLGDEIFSANNVVQTVQWIVSIVSDSSDTDPAAARACLELTHMLTMQTALVDSIERDEDTVARILELVRVPSISPGSIGVLHTLALSSPLIARGLATALASSGGRAALDYLIETIRGRNGVSAAERMLLLALRADPVPGKKLLKALMGAEGGVAMLATLAEQVFDRSSSQRSRGSGSQCAPEYESSSQQEEDGILVLTQDLQMDSQTDGEAGSESKEENAVSVQPGSSSGTTADLVAHYEAVLSEERRNASELMKTMASTAAAERQAMQDQIDDIHKQMNDRAAKHESLVGKLTEAAKRERERRVAIEGSCRREKDEAATSRRQLAAAKEDLVRVQDAAEAKEATLRRGFETQVVKLSDQLATQEAEAEERSAAWDNERQELLRKLVICLDGYNDLEQTLAAEANRAEAEVAKLQENHAQQLEQANQSLTQCEQRCTSIERERQAVTAELREAQTQLHQLKKVSSLMSALIDTTNQQQKMPSYDTAKQMEQQHYSGNASGDRCADKQPMDSPSLRSQPSSASTCSNRAGSGSAAGSDSSCADRQAYSAAEERMEEEGAMFALSQTDQTPHREAKAHLRQMQGAESRRLKRCDATAGIPSVSIRSSSASSTSSADSALSDAVSAVHNSVAALELRLPSWSQAANDDSAGQGTMYFGSQDEPPQTRAALETADVPTALEPAALTPEHSPAFEWQKEDIAANRNRRLAFLAMDPNGTGGSVLASAKPENRTLSDSEDDARKQREKLKLLRAEASCTQPAVGDGDTDENCNYDDGDRTVGFANDNCLGEQSAAVTPIKSQLEHSFGQSSDDDSSTTGMPSPELF